MDWENRCFQAGTAALILAMLIHLGDSERLGSWVRSITAHQVVSAAIFLETGQLLRPVPRDLSPPAPTSPPVIQESIPPPTQPVQAVLGPQDLQAVEVNYFCDYEPDVDAMFREPLEWNLRQQAPTVLILHAHTTESYVNQEGYYEPAPYRCRDEQYNMVAIGQVVARELEKEGIRVLHDKTIHDEPSYDNSYGNARITAEKYLQQYPSLCLVLDLHRDAAEDQNGNQVVTCASVQGQDSAKLMLVVGTDAAGWEHPRWRQNMALAVKLHASLEQQAPGICRPIAFRGSRFNQDLSPGSLLVEVGTAGNTRQQAELAAQVLAKGIANLASGTRWQDLQ